MSPLHLCLNGCFVSRSARHREGLKDHLGPSSDTHAIELHAVLSECSESSGVRTLKILGLVCVTLTQIARHLGVSTQRSTHFFICLGGQHAGWGFAIFYPVFNSTQSVKLIRTRAATAVQDTQPDPLQVGSGAPTRTLMVCCVNMCLKRDR